MIFGMAYGLGVDSHMGWARRWNYWNWNFTIGIIEIDRRDPWAPYIMIRRNYPYIRNCGHGIDSKLIPPLSYAC